MKSTKNENRTRRHSNETKNKIAKGNTGKVFSSERKRNIGNARLIKITENDLNILKELWKKHFVPSKEIRSKLNLSDRVYKRFVDQYCTFEQIKYLNQTIRSEIYQMIIDCCLAKIPYKEIADRLGFKYKWMRHTILKLSKFYDIEPLSKPVLQKTEEHKEKLSKLLTKYNKENPKKKQNNPNWKGGISKLSDLIRESPKYKSWRFAIMKRDNFKCINCEKNGYLHVDHIYPFALILEDGKITTIEEAHEYAPLWNINNGRTLCVECHRKTETYGKQRKNK